MVCPSVFSAIGGYLESKDQARLATTCYAAREGCSRLPHVSVSFEDQTSMDTLRSFASWLAAKADHVETLVIRANMYQWSLAWRYTRVEMPRLRAVHVMHTDTKTLLLAAPEEIMPAAPDLETLVLEAHSLYLGMGFSRLHIKQLEVRSAMLSANVMAFAFPVLETLVLKSPVFETSCFVYGLHNHKHLKYLECPANMLHVAAALPSLQCMTVHWASGVSTQYLDDIRMLSKVSRIRLVGGCWTHLGWIPETVTALECVGCVLYGNVLLKHLEHLTLSRCIIDHVAVQNVDIKHLHMTDVKIEL